MEGYKHFEKKRGLTLFTQQTDPFFQKTPRGSAKSPGLPWFLEWMGKDRPAKHQRPDLKPHSRRNTSSHSWSDSTSMTMEKKSKDLKMYPRYKTWLFSIVMLILLVGGNKGKLKMATTALSKLKKKLLLILRPMQITRVSFNLQRMKYTNETKPIPPVSAKNHFKLRPPFQWRFLLRGMGAQP